MESAGKPEIGAPPAEPRRFRVTIRRPGWVVTIVGIALVVVVTVLATVPVPETASFSFGSIEAGSMPIHFQESWSQSLCPAGAKAVVAFSSTGLNVTFSITAPDGTEIWSQHTTYANASFVVPTCGKYQIGATGSGDGNYAIDATLSYSAPLL